MPTNRLLGLCDLLLSTQRVPGRDPGWSLRPRQLPDSSSAAGRWSLCSSNWRQRIPLKSQTAARSSLRRRRCRLELMLLTFELINKCRSRRERLWRGGFGFSAIDSNLFREKGLRPSIRFSSLGLRKSLPQNCPAVIKISLCQCGWCVQPNAKGNASSLGVRQWEKTWGVWQQFVKD